MAKNRLRTLSGEELITKDEVSKLLDATESFRNKAFISTLYESGCRIGEIGSMRIESVIFDKYGVIIKVHGKTGERTIRLVESAPYLIAWKTHYPLKEDGNAPLWTRSGNGKYEELTYPAIRKMLGDTFKKANINKKFNPHLFRHSKATYMAQHLTEFQMNYYFGWKQGSDMPATYVHLSGKDLDKAVLGIHGIETEENKEKPTTLTKPITCPKCRKPNPSDEKFCIHCFTILDAETVENEQKRQQTDEIMNKLMQNEEVKQFFTKKLKELDML